MQHVGFRDNSISVWDNPPPLPPREPRRIEESQKRKGPVKNSKSAVGLAACSPRGLSLAKSTGSLFTTLQDPSSVSQEEIGSSDVPIDEQLRRLDIHR